MRAGLPYATAGMRVGLFGGSFDPPHAGHLHVSREALKRLSLDRVWWLMSPGNPLKREGPATLDRRMRAARALVHDPRMILTDLEARLGTRYSAQTLEHLFRLYPGVRFVWLMGADNLAGFHRWQQWRWILDHVPVAVFARPGFPVSAHTAQAARTYGDHRLPPSRAAALADAEPPAWCFLNVPMVDLSSSQIRARGDWVR